jgi:hypothetical protein
MEKSLIESRRTRKVSTAVIIFNALVDNFNPTGEYVDSSEVERRGGGGGRYLKSGVVELRRRLVLERAL